MEWTIWKKFGHLQSLFLLQFCWGFLLPNYKNGNIFYTEIFDQKKLVSTSECIISYINTLLIHNELLFFLKVLLGLVNNNDGSGLPFFGGLVLDILIRFRFESPENSSFLIVICSKTHRLGVKDRTHHYGRIHLPLLRIHKCLIRKFLDRGFLQFWQKLGKNMKTNSVH